MSKKQNYFAALNDKIHGKTSTLSTEDIRANPEMFSLVSKLQTSQTHESFDSDGSLQDTIPDLEYMFSVASEKGNDIGDNEDIMALLPDLERGAQILISYIRSPNFLLATELQYRPPVDLFPQTVGGIIISHVQNYFRDRFGLDGKVHGMLYDILITKGARVYVTIPEAALDEIINQTGIKHDINDQKVNNKHDYGLSYSERISRQSFNDIDAMMSEHRNFSTGILGSPEYTESKTTKVVPSTLSLQDSSGLYVGHSNIGVGNDSAPKYVPQHEPTIRVKEKIVFDLPNSVVDIFKSQVSESEAHKDNNPKALMEGIDLEDRTWSLDLTDKDTYLEITEDISLIALGQSRKEKLNEQVNDKLSLQSADDFLRRKMSGMSGVSGTDRDVMGALFKKIDSSFSKSNKDSRMQVVPDNDQTFRENLNEPFIIDWPTESVIPMYKAGRPEEHVYYIVLLDEEGQPVDRSKPAMFYRDLMGKSSYTDGKSMASSLIKQGRQMFQGFDQRWSEARQIEMLGRVYSNAVIKDILTRTRNGIYGKNLEIGEVTEAFRIMFYRSLRGQRTRMLMVPKSLVTYMAFDYDHRGMGVSLIDKMKVLLSLRIQFMLSQVRAGIENSIPRSISTVRIDERDPDPKSTIQKAKTMILQSSGNSALLVGQTNVGTIEDNIFNSGKKINIDTDHPGIPKVGHDVEHVNTSVPLPDQETSDMLSRLAIMGIGLPPSMVDNSLEIDFAAQALQGNFITNLTAYQKQSRFNPFLKEFTRQVTQSSPKLIKAIEGEIEANFEAIMEAINEKSEEDIDIDKLDKEKRKDLLRYLTLKFIDEMDVSLPAPNDDNLEMKNEAMGEYETRIDNAIKYLFTDEAWPSEFFGEEVTSVIGTYGAVVKADLMREWMIENNYMDGIMKYMESLDDDMQSFEKNMNMRSNLKKVILAAMEMSNEAKPLVKSTEAVIKVNDIKGGDDYGSGGGDYSSDTDDASGDEGGDEGGDDFGGDIDFDFGPAD